MMVQHVQDLPVLHLAQPRIDRADPDPLRLADGILERTDDVLREALIQREEPAFHGSLCRARDVRGELLLEVDRFLHGLRSEERIHRLDLADRVSAK